MTLEPPHPPTPPSPAVRPTPPTPPRIDMTPYRKNSADDGQSTRQVDTPEDMARDAVANGSGALTKRTVERGDDNKSSPQQNSPPAQIADTQSDYDKGQDVLRQFKDMDARENNSAENIPPHASTEQPRPAPKLNYHEGHGAVYWLFTIIFVAVAAFIIVKKFLLTDKPSLTKSQLFEDSSSRLKAASDKIKPAVDKKPVAPPKINAKPSPPKNDDKGKHFEIRV